MPGTTFDSDTLVDEIMRRWPATIRVFTRRGMLCVGCPIGPFHTLGEACAEHGLDERAVRGELLDAVLSDGK